MANQQQNQIQLSKQAIYDDACEIIESSRERAYHAINIALTLRNWQLGERIAREELDGATRAAYGTKAISELADQLTLKYGKGFDRKTLYNYIKFYRMFPEIVDSLCRQSGKVDAVSRQLLPWTHYRELIRVENAEARKWYE